MADPTLVAREQALAHNRLMAAAEAVGKKYDVPKQAAALAEITERDPLLRQMLQTQALADLLEGLTAAPKVKGKAKAKGPKEPWDDDDDDEDETSESEEAPETVETVKEDELVTTETVEEKPHRSQRS